MSKVSQYTSGSTLSGPESLYIVQSGNSRKIPVSNILTDPLFTPSGTGAVVRSIQAKDRDLVSVFDFMTTAQIADVQARTKTLSMVTPIQAAVTAVNAANSGYLWFPPGTYRIDSEISVPTNVVISIQGSGREATVIQLNSTTQNGFNVTSDSAVHFSDLQIVGSTSQTAGAGIKVNGATNGVTTNPHSSFTNIGFLFCWHGIEMVSAAQWRISGCEFFGFIDAGIVARDTVSADSGNSFITGNMLTAVAGFSSTSNAIRHLSGGGMHITDNSFITGGAAYRMLWESTTSSSQILLHGNTVDSTISTGGFIFDRTGSGGIVGISIKDNYFNTNAAVPAVWFKTNNATVFSQVTMGGNTYSLIAGGTGIQIDGGITYRIADEQFVANAVGTGIATGNSTATSIYLGDMQFQNILTPYSINTATQVAGGRFFGTSSIDFGNVADGAIGTIGTVTVPGAVVGDICKVGASQLIIGGVFLYATISAANTAKVTAFNKSGGAWNVGAGTVNVTAVRGHI